MNTNTGSGRRVKRLPGPATGSARTRAITRAAVSPSRDSPSGGCRNGSGPLAAGQVTGAHTGTAPIWTRRPA